MPAQRSQPEGASGALQAMCSGQDDCLFIGDKTAGEGHGHVMDSGGRWPKFVTANAAKAKSRPDSLGLTYPGNDRLFVLAPGLRTWRLP
jgi:hypothetical protein